MTDTNGDFSSMDPGSLLQDPQVLRLYRALQQLDPALLQQAAALAAAGDSEGAGALLFSDRRIEEMRDPHGRL